MSTWQASYSTIEFFTLRWQGFPNLVLLPVLNSINIRIGRSKVLFLYPRIIWRLYSYTSRTWCRCHQTMKFSAPQKPYITRKSKPWIQMTMKISFCLSTKIDTNKNKWDHSNPTQKGDFLLPFWCVFYVRQAIKTAPGDLVLHGIVSQSNQPI